MSPAVAAPGMALKDEQLSELLSLLRDADSVELKLTIDESAQRAAVMSLGLDPLEAQIRIVHFFDTPDLTLEKAGVVVRARRIQGKDDDTVVKLRPVVLDQVPDRWRQLRDFVVEVDAMQTGYVCSGSMKGLARLPLKASVGVLEGPPLRKVFTKDQRSFYAEHAPEGIALDDLRMLGPIFVLKAKGTPAGFARKLVAELWLYPDGKRVLELSTKCLPSEGFQVAAELRGFLAERDIKPAQNTLTKTRKALSFFARELGES
jgi:hypothetical protein